MDLSEERKHFQPTRPRCLENISLSSIEKLTPTTSISDEEEIKKFFPDLFGASIVKFLSKESVEHPRLRIGVVLSGGQAAGGHNVIAGVYDALLELNPGCDLIGFLGGPSGIVDGEYKNLEKNEIDEFRNQGGFDIIGSGRTKIETQEQLDKAMRVVKKLELDGLVIIGGDDSNTNAAVLSQHFISNEIETAVVGVPKTIDGDLKNEFVEVSFGFDTATKTYSEMIGNIARDALSAKKYYHFVKLMGRSASHIALECALYTHPNLTFISEEIKEKDQKLKDIVNQIVQLIIQRANAGKNYGIILIPEGLIEFIPEMSQLIKELNHLLASNPNLDINLLSEESRQLFEHLPDTIQRQLTMERDPHGNVQVSHIQTQELLVSLVKEQLEFEEKEGRYKGKFSPVEHFFGYEGRSALPSNFDANYCYSLGLAATVLIANKCTGYMAAIKNLKGNILDWEVYGVPITSLLNMEMRKGKRKPVIQKALVAIDSQLFEFFSQHREIWKTEDDYHFPGPIQFFGDSKFTDSVPPSLTY